MHKKVLTEQAIYYGDLEMPKNFEIDRPSLGLDVFKFGITNKFPISKELDKVNKYIIEYSRAKYKIAIVNKKIEGFMYKPGEITKPVIDIDFQSLKDSVDYTMLYGVGTEDCDITILYDNNRNKQQYHTISLTHNKFVMFPSSNMYFITNHQKENLNIILKITYREPDVIRS